MAKTWWEGTARWSLVYGQYSGLESYALQTLNRAVQGQVPYVVGIAPAGAATDGNLILLGTPDNHSQIAELARLGLISVPTQAGGYAVRSLESPWRAGARLLVIAGRDAHGVLYGVQDFCARYPHEFARSFGDDRRRLRAFNEMPPFEYSDYPRIAHRGIWTWGYVIYDYRAFLDNMARLRMNMLTIWNDQVPLNAREVVDYAHARGIQVVFGFHWGWGIGDQQQLAARLVSAEGRAELKADIVRCYREQYSGLPHDGIYFQSATEHQTRVVEGQTVASIMCRFVNEVAAALWAGYPGLDIQFGLHATSIQDDYPDLKGLDSRVTITWEDAGAVPFTYDAMRDSKALWRGKPLTFERTLEFSRELAVFRPGTRFAIVPKGWSNLDWSGEFENHGPFVLGENSRARIQERLAVMRPVLERREALWESVYPCAMRYYRELLEATPAPMLVTGLVEDGLFEHEIRPSVSVFAQTLWNPCRHDAEILRLARSPYCR